MAEGVFLHLGKTLCVHGEEGKLNLRLKREDLGSSLHNVPSKEEGGEEIHQLFQVNSAWFPLAVGEKKEELAHRSEEEAGEKHKPASPEAEISLSLGNPEDHS